MRYRRSIAAGPQHPRSVSSYPRMGSAELVLTNHALHAHHSWALKYSAHAISVSRCYDVDLYPTLTARARNTTTNLSPTRPMAPPLQWSYAVLHNFAVHHRSRKPTERPSNRSIAHRHVVHLFKGNLRHIQHGTQLTLSTLGGR